MRYYKSKYNFGNLDPKTQNIGIHNQPMPNVTVANSWNHITYMSTVFAKVEVVATPTASASNAKEKKRETTHIQGVRAKFDSKRVFHNKWYISAKKGDIYENQNLLIMSTPRRQIALKPSHPASTTTWRCFPELVEITMALPLLKIRDNTSVLWLSLALVLYMARLISPFITPGTW